MLNSVLNFPVTGFLVVWGWYVVFAVIALFLIKQKLEPQIEAARKKRREQEYANFGELIDAFSILSFGQMSIYKDLNVD